MTPSQFLPSNQQSTSEYSYPIKLHLGYKNYNGVTYIVYIDKSGIKWYRCKICNAHFASEDDAAAHSTTHSH